TRTWPGTRPARSHRPPGRGRLPPTRPAPPRTSVRSRSAPAVVRRLGVELHYLDAAQQPAAMQTGPNALPRQDAGRVAQQLTGLGLRQAVAPGQDTERADGFQPGRRRRHALAAAVEPLPAGPAEAVGPIVQPPLLLADLLQ